MNTIKTKDGEVSDEDFGQEISELEPIKNRPLRSVPTDNGESDAAPTSHALFIIPTRWGNGFQASIHGHVLELADPTDHRLAPSPDDLLIAAIASDLAWSARRLLRANRLPEDVNVSARWQTTEGLPGLADITVTVTVSTRAKAVSEALAASFAGSLAARSLAEPDVHISPEGGNR
jgi:uncharacterized OsmC-like protein